MKVYVLIVNDRRIDIQVQVFKHREAAINSAKERAQAFARHKEDIEEKNIPDWDYYCRYSCEGDHVRVNATQMNEREE